MSGRKYKKTIIIIAIIIIFIFIFISCLVFLADIW